MAHPLWTSLDCGAWAAALARYPDEVARRDERLPALDRWYRETLPALVATRTPPWITHDELVEVASWKMKRGVFRGRNLALVRSNDPEVVVATTRAAFALEGPASLRRVAELRGVGPATASAVLATVRPHSCPFFDEDVARAIPTLGPVAFTMPYYLRYAAALVDKAAVLAAGCSDVSWTAELVGRALWAARG